MFLEFEIELSVITYGAIALIGICILGLLLIKE